MRKFDTYQDVRIGVYAICGDEPSEFIERWLESMKGADMIWVLVTQVTKTNMPLLKKYQKKLEFQNKLVVEKAKIQPWRFDVARNKSLEMVDSDLHPVDALICTDIDEVLIEDFWDDYRQVVFEHPNFDRIMYKFAWSHDTAGRPDRVFWYDKTHQPGAYHWEYPVHETLTKNAKVACAGTYYLDGSKIYLHHYPDQTKSRSSYLGLLELRAQEYPNDLYGLFYLGREYTFVNRWEKCVSTMAGLYLRLVQYGGDDMCMKPAICMTLGSAYYKLNLKDLAEVWFKRGIQDDVRFRDNYIYLAQMYAWEGRTDQARAVLEEMEEKSVYIEDWRVTSYVWRDWKKEQILADCEMWEGNYGYAAVHMQKALEDIATETDQVYARSEGFYNDLKFLQKKLIKEKNKK